jgi:hypothetical protein
MAKRSTVRKNLKPMIRTRRSEPLTGERPSFQPPRIAVLIYRSIDQQVCTCDPSTNDKCEACAYASYMHHKLSRALRLQLSDWPAVNFPDLRRAGMQGQPMSDPGDLKTFARQDALDAAVAEIEAKIEAPFDAEIEAWIKDDDAAEGITDDDDDSDDDDSEDKDSPDAITPIPDRP